MSFFERNFERLQKTWLLVRLWCSNRFSMAPVTSHEVEVVVSMTSYGKRLPKVYLTIESIANGYLKPGRLILWLDNETDFQHLPGSLRRLQQRGLEVRLTSNYGPHTKYYPYVKQYAADGFPLVTADDDILYPHFWLDGLYKAYQADGSVVSCYRAHLITFDQAAEKLAPFSKWGMCVNDKPSFIHHATGVSGVIYPPRLQKALADAGEEFMALCPKADDIWLHVCAIRNGYRVKQIYKDALHFRITPSTQQYGLFQENQYLKLNDEQADKTYTSTDIALLKKEAT